MQGGQLEKLKIYPYADSETVQAEARSETPFVVQFNPETFTINTELDIGPDEPAQGDSGEEAKFKSIKSRSFGFDIYIDGTGASGEKKDVAEEIEHFKKTVGFSGETHRTYFLLVSCGSLVFTCVIESYSVNYKLFKADGTPLRAVLSVSFKEHLAKEKREKEKNLSSPDLSHLYKVQGDEHLSLISQRIYKEPGYYYHVAEVNELNNLRKINSGKSLLLPPLES